AHCGFAALQPPVSSTVRGLMNKKTKIKIGLHFAAILFLFAAYFMYLEASPYTNLFLIVGLLLETLAMVLVFAAWRKKPNKSSHTAADENI
ncbi:MAG: hypothetical protein ACR2PH_06770, partial [Desulfobulbia bacterium]